MKERSKVFVGKQYVYGGTQTQLIEVKLHYFTFCIAYALFSIQAKCGVIYIFYFIFQIHGCKRQIVFVDTES